MDTHEYESVPDICFKDDSFTLSYSLEKESWTSFHDYVPDFAFSLRNKRYIQFFNNSMYEMNVGRMGMYFDVAYTMYITPVFTLPLKEAEYTRKFPFMINSISWNTDIVNGDIRELEETWASISLHNSHEGTRDIALIPMKENCTFQEQYKSKANTRRLTNNWVFNYAFDEKENPGITWEEVLDRFYTKNTTNKDCKFRSPLRDDYVIVKLMYSNLDNKRLYFYELDFDINVIKKP